MIFASDNWAGAHPKVSESLSRHAGGFDAAYGAGALDRDVEETFARLFEREVAVFFVGTGTAANALSLVMCNRPGGIALCHREAHILEDECGAPEYFTGGARLYPVDGALGKMDLGQLDRALDRFAAQNVHSGRAMAISVTQATEIGTLYSLDELDAISARARAHGLPLNMDGARFANALVALQATPAEMTWKRGVDLVSFGGTKNGCWCAEAVLMFDTDRAREFPFARKRAAQLFSKSRFIAAQFAAYFEDDLWLENASHANAMAARLAARIAGSTRLRLAWQPQANEVFAVMHRDTMAALHGKGAKFYDWPRPHGADALGPDEVLGRFVTSFATTQDEIDRFGDLIA